MPQPRLVITGKKPPESLIVQSAQLTSSSFELKPHQVQAVKLLGGCDLVSRLIGDEMRVGKTPTAIAIDHRLRSEVARKQRGNNCTLIVCPKSVLDVWRNHLLWMGVEASAITTIDLPQKQAFKKILGKVSADKRKADAKRRYLICNWDAVQTIKKELLNAGPWFHIIGDEIHRIKGRATKRTEAFKRVKAKFKTGLSGTPADNRPEDFWSVLHWLYPQDFSSYWNFVERYCSVRTTRTGFKVITGVRRKELPHLRERIAPFYIRRKLADVADSLPQKQYRIVTVGMGARQRREYDTFERKQIVDVQGGDFLGAYDIVVKVRLQQMAIGCCEVTEDEEVHITDSPASPKLDKVMEIIEDDGESGPFIIFAQHHDTIRLTRVRLERKGYTVSSVIGTDGPDERASAIKLFQDGTADIFIGTIGSCREGITLNRANTIVFVDRAWNPNWNRQAEARADALDSHLPVSVIILETEDSIDQDRALRIDAKGRDTDEISRSA